MTPRRWNRVFFYLLLALSCYLIAVAAGGRVAFGLFLTAGVIGELFFWKELIWPSRR